MLSMEEICTQMFAIWSPAPDYGTDLPNVKLRSSVEGAVLEENQTRRMAKPMIDVGYDGSDKLCVP